MRERRTPLLCAMLVAASSIACPTRQNPDLPDGWDSTADTGTDTGPDAGPDAEPDGATCGYGQILCEEECVSANSLEHCGDCDTRCDTTVDDCQCVRRGDDGFGCWVEGEQRPPEFTPCELP